MREVFINFYGLFYKPNPDSPYGLNRAEVFRENRRLYEKKLNIL